jgi:pimeloyl-ACP methyl ester carboxylesterase
MGQHQVAVDDRKLTVCDQGDPGGPSIPVDHGAPWAGPPYAGWVRDANARGARLIAYDRPGYGASTPAPGRAIADGAGDAAAIMDARGVQRFATWGVSGGGPHAPACAALLRDGVTAACSIGGRASDATRCNRTVPPPARLPKWFRSANGRSHGGHSGLKPEVGAWTRPLGRRSGRECDRSSHPIQRRGYRR